MYVDNNDFLDLASDRGEQSTHSDSAHASDEQRRRLRRLEPVEHSTSASLQATAQRCECAEVGYRGVRHLDAGRLADEGQPGE